MPVVNVPMMVEASVATMKAFCALRQLSVRPVLAERNKCARTLRLFSSIMLE
jgi:hypothetical protein